MNIEPGKTYRIKGNFSYFNLKYGTPNPQICIEDRDTKVFEGKSWREMTGNPTALQFSIRTGTERRAVTFNVPVYYGKVNGLGELVWEDELEELPE